MLLVTETEVQNTTGAADRIEPGGIDRFEFWRWSAVYTGIAVLFSIIAYLFSTGRSLHIDEVATFLEGARRITNPDYQAQHGWFLDAFHWYSLRVHTLGAIRLPSIVASALALTICGFLGRALSNGWAGLCAVLLLLSVPQVWTSAIEARFYGFLLLFGALSFGGLVFCLRGKYLLALPLLIIPGLVAYKFHVAAAPFHAVLAGCATLVFCWRGAHQIRVARRQKRALTAKEKAHTALAGMVLIAAFVILLVSVSTIKDLFFALEGRSANKPEERIENGWSLLGMVAHSLSWAGGRGSRLAESYPPIFLLAAVAIGFGALVRQRFFTLAGVLALSIAVHYGLAFYSSYHTLFAIKYLTSSLVVVGVVGGVGLAILAGSSRVACSLAILLSLPVAWSSFSEVRERLLGDPSNAITIAKRMEALSKAQEEPILLAPIALLKIIDFHADLGFCKPVDGIAREELNPEAEKTLIMRRGKFFKAEILYADTTSIAGIPTEVGYREDGPFYSSFDKDYHYNLWSIARSPILAPGMGGEVPPGSPGPLFVEGGSWVVEVEGGTALIDGKEYRTGDVYRVESFAAPDVFTRPAGLTVSFWVDYSEEAARSAAFASAGPLLKYNQPVDADGASLYMISNNIQVDYDFSIPMEEATLVIRLRSDAPKGGAFAVQFDGKIAGVFEYPPEGARLGDSSSFELEVPKPFLGQVTTIGILNLGANSVNRADSDSVRVLYLESLAIRRGKPSPGAAPNRMGSMSFSAAPAWMPGGVADFSKPGSEKNIAIFGGQSHSKLPAELRVTSEGLRIPLREQDSRTGYFIRGLPIEDDKYGIVNFEMRTEGLEGTTVALLFSVLDEDGNRMGGGDLAKLTVGRRSERWTNRAAIIKAPPGASEFIPIIYINRTEKSELEAAPTLILRSITFNPFIGRIEGNLSN